ncbi:growth hormone receptor isoform X1 [Ascaphus truei]|uniref:growth hormone receptor isoform X1 n=2 Tax=Ascaphus truei TaxID=8439 RepID=UPI003F59C371
MALWLLLVTLALVCADDSLSPSEVTSGRPRITQCRSPQQETFTCYWTYGDFHNLSSPGLIKLQYRKMGELNWTDCPDNVSAGENSCYFNKTYTSVWVSYCIQLVNEDVVLNGNCFTVDNIVQPDPPVALNWTVMNISLTGIHVDIQVTWEPPPSADVKSGWISLQYEVQIKELNDSQWIKMDLVSMTYLPVYSLKIGREYEVRVRCKQRTNEKFGEFSDVLHIPLLIVSDAEFPWLFFVLFGLIGASLLLLFILLFKQKSLFLRLKMFILPPVPVPKIKGIDPDLLQKGKLDEVNFILACHDNYKPQLYNDDPWVEFIELDLDDPDEKTDGSDTDRLLGEEHLKSHSCLGVKDDDSGRASCCEPDIPETDFSNSDTCDGTSDIAQPQNVKENEENLLCLDDKEDGGSPSTTHVPTAEDLNMKTGDDTIWPLIVSETESRSPPASIQLSNVSSKPSMDFYALVSDISQAGRLLLSSGQRIKTENEECSEPVIQSPANLNTDNGYICESAVTAFCPVNVPREGEPNVQHNSNEDSYFTTESLTISAMNSCSADKASSSEIPVSDYTSVHIINSPQSLVLNTTVLPDKDFLTCGYMTTDQVNKVMP